jgi:hypothetical protein
MTVDVAVSSINSDPVSTIIPEGLRTFELWDQLAFIRGILKYLQSDHEIDKVQEEKGIEVVQACDLRMSSPRFSASLRASSYFPRGSLQHLNSYYQHQHGRLYVTSSQHTY